MADDIQNSPNINYLRSDKKDGKDKKYVIFSSLNVLVENIENLYKNDADSDGISTSALTSATYRDVPFKTIPATAGLIFFYVITIIISFGILSLDIRKYVLLSYLPMIFYLIYFTWKSSIIYSAEEFVVGKHTKLYFNSLLLVWRPVEWTIMLVALFVGTIFLFIYLGILNSNILFFLPYKLDLFNFHVDIHYNESMVNIFLQSVIFFLLHAIIIYAIRKKAKQAAVHNKRILEDSNAIDLFTKLNNRMNEYSLDLVNKEELDTNF